MLALLGGVGRIRRDQLRIRFRSTADTRCGYYVDGGKHLSIGYRYVLSALGELVEVAVLAHGLAVAKRRQLGGVFPAPGFTHLC